MFFDSSHALLRVLVVGSLAYAALVLLLRVSGKRTLSKFNAFDFVVTVAIGSTLATVLLSKQVALAEGVLAFLVLIGLQMAITWLSVRSPRFQNLIKAEPRLLLLRGRVIESALRAERVTTEELMAALRGQGYADPNGLFAVVLETDGSIAVISDGEPPVKALRAVRGYGSS